MQAEWLAEFRDGLRALGYEEGRTIGIEYRWAEGRFERLPDLAAELVAIKVDVIVTAAPQSVRAAQHATSTIPIVITAHDPVGMGFIQSLAHPGGNITGVAFQDAELSTKRLDLLRESVPRLSRVAVLWHKEGSGTAAVQAVEASARGLGIQVHVLEIREPQDFARAVASAKSWGAQGLVQLASPFITKNRAAPSGATQRESPSGDVRDAPLCRRGVFDDLQRQPEGALSAHGVFRRSNSERRPSRRPSGRAAA